jgi:hypothetical protein
MAVTVIKKKGKEVSIRANVSVNNVRKTRDFSITGDEKIDTKNYLKAERLSNKWTKEKWQARKINQNLKFVNRRGTLKGLYFFCYNSNSGTPSPRITAWACRGIDSHYLASKDISERNPFEYSFEKTVAALKKERKSIVQKEMGLVWTKELNAAFEEAKEASYKELIELYKKECKKNKISTFVK